MKEDATTGEQQIESLGVDLSGTLEAVSIHGSQSGPDAPMKRTQLLQKGNYSLRRKLQR
jgi:hypothetical protein